MPSNEDEHNDGDTSSDLLQKKHKIQRACDICRRKKIRCDGGNRCSNCISCSVDCTYTEAAKKRGPPKGYLESEKSKVEKLEKLLRRLCPDEAVYNQLIASLDSNLTIERPPVDPSALIGDIASKVPESYVESLENRLEKLERLLRRLCPDDAVYNELNACLDCNWTIERPAVDPSALVGDIASKAQLNAPTLETVIAGILKDKSGTTRSGPHDDDDPSLILADNLKQMVLTPNESRFFGKSSDAMLVQTAIELRNEYTGDEGRFDGQAKPAKRTEFWNIRPWECRSGATSSPEPGYNFPDLDLALHCIDLYFLHSNLYLPLLHRPTFDKSVKERLYLTNDSFAQVFLLVCAVGARHSDSPQVRLDGIDSHHSAGWKWFEQVQIMKRSLLVPPTLYDFQLYCLYILYLNSSSAPQSCWTWRELAYVWHRMLVSIDESSSLGRPCAIQDEDFDIDLPVDCDDEYWDHPDLEERFKQPANKPSSVTSFILTIKLQQILAFSLRTIYSINKSKILLGFVGEQWEQHIVAELDSALNKWVDSVPDHLRWDPNREEDTFFNQSVHLFVMYYHIQIIIHRPFIPSPSKPSPLSFPSLAICTNAARSCSHVVDIHRKRNTIPLPLTQMPVFTSGVVLLLSIWGGKRSGLSMDPNKEMEDVHKCMKVLQASEARWHSAGRLWDVLYELACVGELPLPQPSPPSMKREREWDSPSSSNASELTSSPMSQNETSPRAIAGSRRVRKEPSFINQTQQLQTPLPQHQPSQAAPPPSAVPQSHIPPPSSQRAPSRSRPHGQIRPNESQQTASTIPPFNTADLNVFALPVYSNDLGRLPLHGQMTFTAQAHLSQPQPPQPDPETSYWYTASQPTSHADASRASSSYVSHHPPAPAPLQHPYPHHYAPQSISERQFPSASETSSAAQDSYGMDAELATGLLFDAMLGRADQWSSTYGLGPIHSSIPSMGSGSMASTAPQSNSGSSMEDVYRGMGMETTPDRSGGQYEHQPQGVLRQQEQQVLSYPFVLDNDTEAIWSTAPTGVQRDQWGTYLANISELMQDHGHQHPSV